eukprot:6489060-Karenia_brevis.AAC.1
MRKEANELWKTKDGHTFAGSGYNVNTRGVAILIHKRWTPFVKQFVPVNERIPYVDISRGRFNIRAITAYFPHS